MRRAARKTILLNGCGRDKRQCDCFVKDHRRFVTIERKGDVALNHLDGFAGYGTETIEEFLILDFWFAVESRRFSIVSFQ
jgi:hypothetical protein